MTSELATFTSRVISVNQSVYIAIGSSIPIRSQGDTYLSSDITLFSVYYVLNFAYNLFFVSCLAKNLNCVVVFLPSRCFLQGLTSKRFWARGMSEMDYTTLEIIYHLVHCPLGFILSLHQF